MTNYPVWWDTTITIFNKNEDLQTHVIKWYKTVVHGVFWKYVQDKMTIGETTLETKKIICRIREDEKFLEKYQWIDIPNDQMENYFTLGLGDIIIRGKVDDEIDEYTDGKRSTDIVEKYKALQGCMEIEGVSINVGRGRCNPHYLAEGL